MGTRIIATGADWSGKGKPNISPFISISDADFAYDFRPRASKYNDLTKKTALALMRGALSAGNASIAFNVDDTVGLVSADGFGLTVDNLGAAFISHTPKPWRLTGACNSPRMWSAVIVASRFLRDLSIQAHQVRRRLCVTCSITVRA